MSEMTPDEAMTELIGQEFGDQVVTLTKKVATLRVRLLQVEQVLDGTQAELEETRGQLEAAMETVSILNKESQSHEESRGEVGEYVVDFPEDGPDH